MINITFDDKYFGPGLGMGCWFKSKERAPLGEVRCIRGVLFYAYMHDSEGLWFPTRFTNWIPVNDAVNCPGQMQSFWEQVLARCSNVKLKERQTGEAEKV